MDPENGMTTLNPKFEGTLTLTAICYDNRGAFGTGTRRIRIINPGTWLNHPPVNYGNPARPQVVRAGEELILTAPDLGVMDPDGDQLYASCNIGSCGQTNDGGFIWTFQTNFPGFYNVEIIFYDIRGGYVIMRVPVEVKPWWSY